jgi:hypothetical protein
LVVHAYQLVESRAPLAAPSRAQLSTTNSNENVFSEALVAAGGSRIIHFWTIYLIFLAPYRIPIGSSPCWEESETSGGSFGAGAYFSGAIVETRANRQNSTTNPTTPLT